jgi:putative membrane protein
MSTLANVLVALIGALHLYILVLEMFLWRGPRARAAFGMTPEFAEATAVLAGNQGLYNGFLAAGLFWGLLADDPVGREVTVFFLLCVAVAGIYGAMTANRRIVFVQTVPAVLALVAVLAS